ncbi:carbohydrate-binding family 9-like protein [Chitinophaga arvensicola]|uniref:Carbohydrate-binding family 9 n=1 Tax=Chitinophaga arvensicola TaxID=29529 RepID=A0A1I0S723_9BACT|nr:carbohydrate-binding family 9-like protein [Chitinophaga arvensicola]SEW51534.1 Carbohydrate-binding family 9 [Chitinophaga arvensicola]
MKTIEVPYFELREDAGINYLANYLRRLPGIEISKNPWPQYSARVKASCRIAYSDTAIFLQYKVAEPYLTASSTINGDIHKDSCVEFFLALDNSGNYYNMEFNCLGVSKIGYGKKRDQRQLIDDEKIAKIRSLTTIDTFFENSKRMYNWELTLVIHQDIFFLNQHLRFRDLHATGNFYKCGDSLPEPHYLCWNMIDAASPDFHQKDFFGNLVFSPVMQIYHNSL